MTWKPPYNHMLLCSHFKATDNPIGSYMFIVRSHSLFQKKHSIVRNLFAIFTIFLAMF